MKVILSALKGMGNNPLKSILTLITVGFGAAVLILSMSISAYFENQVMSKLNENGLVVFAANGEFSDSGSMETERPPEFDENVMETLLMELDGITGVSPVTDSFWNEINVDGTSYQIRNTMGVSSDYFEIFNLEPIVGSLLSDENFNNADKVAVLTRSTAEALYGSVDNALGATFSPPSMILRRRNSSESQNIVDIYTVIGIIEDPSEIQRKSYGTPDLLFPATAALPPMINAQMGMSMILGRLVIGTDQTNLTQVESQIQSILNLQYSDGIDPITLTVWEGNPDGPSDYLTETRNTIETFSLIVNLLGILLLITGSIGILSIMIVEIIGKNKEIAIHRALGASKAKITKEFFTRSLTYSVVGGVVGIMVALVFSSPLKELLLPLIAGIEDTGESIITPMSILLGFGATILTGGLLGTLPIFQAMDNQISESIREG